MLVFRKLEFLISTYFINIFITEESAKEEKAWHKTGEKVGLQVWRIVVSTSTIFHNGNTCMHACIYAIYYD